MTISWKTCFRIGVTVLLLLAFIVCGPHILSLLKLLLGAVTPIVVGLAIAYVLNILMSCYERFYFPRHLHLPVVAKSRRIVCILAAIFSLCAIIALVVGLVIPELVSCISFLIAEIPPAMEHLLQSEWLAKLLPEDVLSMLSGINWENLIAKGVQIVTEGIGSAFNTLLTAVTSVISGVVTAFLGVIFAIYLLLSKEKLQSQCRRLAAIYVKSAWVEKLLYWLRVLNECFRRYIVGQCTEAVILGLLCMLGMFLLRIPYAAMIGTLVGFTALIPVAGAYIGAAIGAVMILTVSPVKALVFLIFLVILQQLEGNLIYPRVVGKTIGLPAIWVLAAVTVGGGVMGIPGMLIGVPIAAALYRLLRENLQQREAQSGTGNLPTDAGQA